MIKAVGFVGFGEAGFHIAKGLRGAGLARIFAYDIDTSEKVRGRARDAQTELLESNEALAAASEAIFSAVTADQATKAAAQTAPYLNLPALLCRSQLGFASNEADHRANRLWSAFRGSGDDGAGSSARPPSPDVTGRRGRARIC